MSFIISNRSNDKFKMNISENEIEHESCRGPTKLIILYSFYFVNDICKQKLAART